MRRGLALATVPTFGIVVLVLEPQLAMKIIRAIEAIFTGKWWDIIT